MINRSPAVTAAQDDRLAAPWLYRRVDALVLGVLLLARLRIDTWAEAVVLPLRRQDVARQPFLGQLLSRPAMELLAQQQTIDPIGLLLVVAALAGWLVYLLVDEFVSVPRLAYRIKLLLIWLIVLVAVFAPSLKLVLLRQGSGPASYSHDGGVIQTEAAIDYLLTGRNPYVEDYVKTPMAEWGINEFRTALYHYPYLPWTFLFSAPFKLLIATLIGWYDQRFVYLLLFALTLAMLPGLAGRAVFRGQVSLLLVMLIALNPLMGSDLIYGQNDSFVLFWIVLSLWLWMRAQLRGQEAQGLKRNLAPQRVVSGWYLASAAALGLACASKPTAWFLAPFYTVLLAVPIKAGASTAASWRAGLSQALRRGWPVLAVALLVIGPYLLWNPTAMIDDVWGWSAGTSPTAYQIWGWGASNLVLALGWVPSRFAYWPFWLPELLVALPLLALLLWRQVRCPTLARACWSYGLFLLAFFFVSRFLNENYLGYILAFLVLGAFARGAPLAIADS